jgi:HJR/Mrr/RecB family endonuclease
MSGEEFQMFVAELFSSAGYSIAFAKPRLALGYDVAAARGAERALVRTARRLAPVGSELIGSIDQARRDHPGVTRLIVVTSNQFNPRARSLARHMAIELWDREALKARMDNRNLVLVAPS